MVPASTLRARRASVEGALGEQRALVFAGYPAERNFPANVYPFRASSHFLYLVGRALEGAVLELKSAGSTLFIPEVSASDRLWHGDAPSPERLSEELGVTVLPLGRLADAQDALTLPVAAGPSQVQQLQIVGRLAEPLARDRLLSECMVKHRSVHDEDGLRELSAAAEVTRHAHLRGLKATTPGAPEWLVRAAMQGAVLECNCTVAYQPIVTTHGQVLHQHDSSHTMAAGDLLLVDFGAERPSGYACDVTRTWPVRGSFSPLQRQVYEVVLQAQERAIDAAVAGVRYRDIHLAAAHALCEGLTALGLFRGDPQTLVAEGAYALFFPHGVGHLIGLDVHDMEDLGDLAGYPESRQRSTQFGLSSLRLDRDLESGMAVTIEPGFYCVPAILDDPERASLLDRFVDRSKLEAIRREVRGIRIEDIVVVEDEANRVITEGIPKQAIEVERLSREQKS